MGGLDGECEMRNLKESIRTFSIECDMSNQCVTDVSNHIWIHVKVETNMVWIRVRALIQSQLASVQ